MWQAAAILDSINIEHFKHPRKFPCVPSSQHVPRGNQLSNLYHSKPGFLHLGVIDI